MISLGTQADWRRTLTVWILVTAAAVACWAALGSDARSLTSAVVWSGTFDDLLVAVASAALTICACWLWVVTTLTVADLLRGRESTGREGMTRRLVLAACGVVVLAGISGPAMAGGSGQHVLAGLPLPDRATAGAPTHQSPTQERAISVRDSDAPITVRPGDSLWSIARSDLGPDAALGEIDQRWRAMYAANSDRIGADPDLIRPGQHLRPAPHTDR